MHAQLHLPCGQRQRGAVAILFGIVALVLFGFMALVIDLGRMYVTRTELQNAADAAALAGAKKLDQTAAGVTSGIAHAVAVAAQNRFKFSSPVVITAANISVGSCPDDACMVAASTITDNASAAGRTFMKVDINSGSMSTFFAAIPTTPGGTGTAAMSTYGMAVAGRFVNNVTPIGVCALNTIPGEVLPSGELAQFGFRRGVTYNPFEVGPLGGPSDPYLLNPVDAYPNACSPSNSSANFIAPFLCNGTSAVVSPTALKVYGNPGMEANQAKALNSRFNQYGGGSVCIPSQAPPDANVRHFDERAAPSNRSADWMSPDQTQQNFELNPADLSATTHGVLWSYSKAVRAVGTTPNAKPGTAYGVADWSTTLYTDPGGVAATASYPTEGTPYTSSSYTLPPVGNPGQANRRVLNLVIANCAAVVGTGVCTEIPVLGIGRFFMQIPAEFTGSPKKLHVEFAGLVDPIPTAEIKLYR